MRRFGFVPAVVVGAVCALAAAQQPELTRPMAASRFVQYFDFEERLTNPNPVPRFWTRVHDAPLADGAKLTRPILPRWNQAELVFKQDGHLVARGEASVRLPTGGGSTRLVLEPGVIPVFAGADYRVNAMVRTKDLHFARARVLVRFLERDGTPILASEKKSDLIVSSEEWLPVSLEMVGEHLRAAFLQVQLDLVQPAQFEGANNPAKVVIDEDFQGAAYFDDIEVVQLPRAEITTSAPLNLEVWPKVPEIVVRVRDMTGEKLGVRIEIFDAQGNSVDVVSRVISSAERVSYTPTLSKLGWYRAVMTITTKTAVIGTDSVDFGVLPPLVALPGEAPRKNARLGRLSSADRRQFGVIAGALHARVMEDIHELPKRIGTGSITLDATGLSTAPEAPLARAVARVLDEWQEVTLSVTRLPIDGSFAERPLSALASTKESVASIEPLLDRFGQRVRRYQFGSLGDDEWFWEPDANKPGPVARALQRYVSGPIVAVPLRLDRTPWLVPNEFLDVSFFVPYGLMPDAVGLAVADLGVQLPRPGERQGMTIAFECAPEGMYSPRAAAGNLVRRAVEAWIASPVAVPNMALVEPWSIVGPRQPQMMPRAELVAWRSTIDRLLDRRVIARFPSAVGTRVYLLGPVPGAPSGSTGALVAWNDSAPESSAFFEAYLGGSGIRIVDIFGNESEPVLAKREGASGREAGIHVALGEEPVFIEGVDTALARFLSDFKLEPSSIEPGTSTGDHQLILRNPFGAGISGTVTLLSPSRSDAGVAAHEWKISPHVARFAAGPGEEARIPLAITAGSGIELGPQAFVFQVEIEADGDYPLLEIQRDMHVGLSNVRISLSYRVLQNEDLVLEVALTNISETPINLSLTAFAPDQPRQPATISGLPPSNQSIRRFVYPGLARALRGKRLSINLADADSGVRVATSIAVE